MWPSNAESSALSKRLEDERQARLRFAEEEEARRAAEPRRPYTPPPPPPLEPVTAEGWQLAGLLAIDARPGQPHRDRRGLAGLPHDRGFVRIDLTTAGLLSPLWTAEAQARADALAGLEAARQAFKDSEEFKKLARLRANLAAAKQQQGEAERTVQLAEAEVRRLLAEGSDSVPAEQRRTRAETDARNVAAREALLAQLVEQAETDAQRALRAAIRSRRSELLAAARQQRSGLAAQLCQALGELIAPLRAADVAVECLTDNRHERPLGRSGEDVTERFFELPAA